MNTSTVSSFFSRDVFLKRQARTRKRPTHAKLCPSTSSTTKPLPMIMEEEDEPRLSSSSSRSPSPGQYPTSLSAGVSPTFGVKSQRRHANLSVSDIRIAKATLVHDDSDFTQDHPALLSAPRPAPRPPISSTPSPEPSPDPFSLKFPDVSLRFPHPPIPTPSLNITFDGYRCGSESPTPSMSSYSSTSPESRSTGLPTTPSSSDDEFPSYYSLPLPNFNPRRVSIKPLVIMKHNHSSTPDDSLPSISSLLESSKNGPETPLPSPFALEDHSDSEDDSEWYNREFSKILTLCSPPLNFSQKSRPESVCFPTSSVPSPTPTPTSPAQGFPSVQLDPAFPRRRRNRFSIPKYPPPPVPVVPAYLRSPPTTPSKPRSDMLIVTPPIRRPPPRSSIPADCVLVDEAFSFSDESGSAFSFSLYESPSTISLPSESPKSFYSQQSFQSPQPSPFPSSFPSTPSSFPSSANEEFDFPVDEIEFDMDMDNSMMLPLSLPTSPIDLEADIASGLEQLRNAPQPPQFKSFVGVSDADLFTTGEASSSTSRTSAEDEDSRELRSRWSSSTLGSIREEHARRSGLGLAASAKLRAYFGGSAQSPKSPLPSKATRASASGRRSGSVSGAGSAIPLTPLTPASPTKRFRHARRESDVMAIGYGYQQPLRRRGSLSPSVSDAGSEESASSSGSSGLRRKPIPVEMFLRSAA